MKHLTTHHLWCSLIFIATIGCGTSAGSVDDESDAGVDGEACDPRQTGYADADGDGFGTGNAVQICEDELGFAPRAGDCNDADAAVRPDADERPADGIDSNCDSLELCHADGDGDGVASENMIETSDLSCSAPGLLASAAALPDCDDALASVYPGAEEVCNGRDDDCDGSVDEGLLIDVWPDRDGDGFGDGAVPPQQTCALGDAQVENGDDCDDDEALAYSDAVELCDGIDNNCDGVTDLDAEDRQNILVDRDQDGFGGAIELLCPGEVAEATRDGDCNDADGTVFPDAPEVDGLGVDANCDGRVRCYQDFDRDGSASTRLVDSGDAFCEGLFEAVESEVGPDCNDSDLHVYPGAPDAELDGVDQDCSDTPYFEREPYEAYGCEEREREQCNGYDDDCDGVVDNDFACYEEGIVPLMEYDGEWWGVGWLPLVLPLGPPRVPVLFNALDLEASALMLDETWAFNGDWARWSGDGEQLILSQDLCVDIYESASEVETVCGDSIGRRAHTSFYRTSSGVGFFATKLAQLGGSRLFVPGLWIDGERVWENPSIVVPGEFDGLVAVITTNEPHQFGTPRITARFVDDEGTVVETHPFQWSTSTRLGFANSNCDAVRDAVVCQFGLSSPEGDQWLGLVLTRELGWRIFARVLVRDDLGSIDRMLPDGRYLVTGRVDGRLQTLLRSPTGEVLSRPPESDFGWYFESVTMMAAGTVPPIWAANQPEGGSDE